jgi:uncharacterized integral membrane protein (TIGR00698 family)
MYLLRTVRRLLPGLLLCLAITLAALVLEQAEEAVFGRAWLEALVLAILLGTAVRSLWRPGDRYAPGIGFGAKALLEVAVLLLGLSVSFGALLAVGPGLLLGIAALVVVAIGASYLIGRGLGLPRRMAILVGCGNSICGNSAIAAVAPVIGATGKDVAASIAFTAVLGVVVVLTLPLLVALWGLTETQYGVLAGLTVYAVPQVLAATVPVGVLSAQVGTLVKLVRVLMLGPAVLLLSLIAAREGGSAAQRKRPPLHRMVPWFIIGFLLLAGLRSAGLVPQAILAPAAVVADLLTVLAMAALGLGVDVRSVARAGARVTAAAVLSLLLLLGMSLVLIRVLHIA